MSFENGQFTIAERMGPAMRKAVRSLVNKETKAVEGMLQGHIKDFPEPLMAYYQQFRKTVYKGVRPSYTVHLFSQGELAANLLGIEDWNPEELSMFANSYCDVYALRHTSSSQRQLLKLFESIGTKEAILERLEDWKDTRADKVVTDELTREKNAASKETWRQNAVRRIRWVTIGKNCPLCNKMAGNVISIEGNFAEPGDVVKGADPKGHWVSLKVKGKVGHPPLHAGCDCTIKPVIG